MQNDASLKTNVPSPKEASGSNAGRFLSLHLVCVALLVFAVINGFKVYYLLSFTLSKEVLKGEWQPFPPFQVVDIFVGFACLFCTIYALVTIVKLQKFRTGSPGKIVTLVLVDSIASALHIILGCFAMGVSVDGLGNLMAKSLGTELGLIHSLLARVIISCVLAAAFLLITQRVLAKYEDLFVK